MKVTWKAGGVLLGLVFFAAVLLAKPVGISTEFVVTMGLIWDAISPGVVDGSTSTNAYLASGDGKMAAAISDPLAAYGLYFAGATVLGGLVSHLLRRKSSSGTEKDRYTGSQVPVATDVPKTWTSRFGPSLSIRLMASFAGGVFVLYGARLAGGCTSGHMMSGMMQTSISGYVFALGAFGAAVPIAYMLYRKA